MYSNTKQNNNKTVLARWKITVFRNISEPERKKQQKNYFFICFFFVIAIFALELLNNFIYLRLKNDVFYCQKKAGQV